MASQDIITRHLCMAVDVEKYSRLDTPQQEVVQADLLRVLEESAVLSGLDRTLWKCQAQGDQEFAVLPADISEAVMLGDFVRHLSAALEARNVQCAGKERMRLRLAMDVGVARTAALGHSGPAPITVARHLNAPQFKRVLGVVTSAHLAVIVSDHLYHDVVRLRGHGLDPEEYTRVHIQHAEFTGYGWIHIPGHSPAQVHAAAGNAGSREAPATAPTLGETRMNIDNIAGLAAPAVIAAMATDGWSYVRGRCAALFRKHAPEQSERLLAQLDEFEEALAESEPADRTRLAAGFAQRMTEDLALIAGLSSEAADALRDLVRQVGTEPAGCMSHSNLTFRNIKTSGGDFNWSGRDTWIQEKHQ